MLFRIATAPDRLGWAPAVFWAATAAEMEMALEGLQGKFRSQPFISREELRRLAVAHGKKRSLKEDPRATEWGRAKT